MGYCGGKIQGHSGTQFKHREAFSKIYNYHKSKTFSKNKTIINQYSERSASTILINSPRNSSIKILKIIALILISLLIIKSVKLLNSKTSTYLKGKQEILDRKNKIDESEMERYNLLIKSGYKSLKIDQLNDAQTDFVRALRIHEYGKEARFGLISVLNKQCNQNGKFCRDALDNENFVRLMGWLNETSAL